jgi:eukaryotic-like serine/threonine-protein kinase
LGSTLFWIVSGEKPFAGHNEVSTLRAVIQDDAPDLRTRRPDALGLGSLLLRMMAKDPAGRPANAEEVVQALLGLGPASPEEAAAFLLRVESDAG